MRLADRKRNAHRSRRRLMMETLESRLAMTAEGQTFAVDQSLDTSGLLGTITGTIQWGDGTSSAATLLNAPATGTVKIKLDYSYDQSGFFASNDRRLLLQAAADLVASKFTDTLTAIQPVGTDIWDAKFKNPATGVDVLRRNMTINANELLIFAGARSLGSTEGGKGDRGGYFVQSSRQTFIDTVQARGNNGALASPATDVGPWGGSVAFDTSKQWYFGTDPAGLNSQQLDFLSVAVHEFIHVLGFGSTASWDNKVINGKFNGASAVATYGAAVPLGDSDHFANSLIFDGQRPTMVPILNSGERLFPTKLDLATMKDAGWQLIAQSIRVTGNHVFGDNGTYPGQITLRGSQLGSKTVSLPATITNTNPTLLAPPNTTATAGQGLSLSQVGKFTDPGFGTANTNPRKSETFTYRIDWGDGSAVDTGNATISALGSATQPTVGFFDGAHTYAAPGTYSVSLRITDDDGGFANQSFQVVVAVPQQLLVSVSKNSFPENGGAGVAKLSIERIGFNNAVAIDVLLNSSDTTEVTVPAKVTIAAGSSTASVDVTAVDDTLLDGTIRALLSASVGTLKSNSVEVNVTDFETIRLSLDRTSISEAAGAGAAVLTVTRSNTDNATSLTVALTSSDTTEATIPPNVTIPASAASTTAGVFAVDDALWDGDQTVRFAAIAALYQSIDTTILVTDYQPIELVAARTELQEDIPELQSTTASVSIRSPAPAGGATIDLSVSTNGVLIFPTSVKIPAGSMRVEFPVSVINDTLPQALRTVTLRASGAGMIADTLVFTIRDSDPAPWTNPVNPYDVDNSGGMDPLDVLVVINEINRRGSRQLDPVLDAGLPFVDSTRDGWLDPLDVLVIVNQINRG